MTATKAIEYLEQIDNRIGLKYINGEADAYVPDYLKKAVYIAVKALQEKLERENPQPLGLEELIKMDGEPVWCCYEKENHEIVTDCRLTSPGAFGCIGIDEKYLLYREYGSKWLAYRHKPDLVSVNKIEHIGEATNMVEGE